jgi:hypothetical protein
MTRSGHRPEWGSAPQRPGPHFAVGSGMRRTDYEGGALVSGIRRCEFITLLGGAAAWPLPTRAQRAKMARIGALYIGIADAETFKTNLREGLHELGYIVACEQRLSG